MPFTLAFIKSTFKANWKLGEPIRIQVTSNYFIIHVLQPDSPQNTFWKLQSDGSRLNIMNSVTNGDTRRQVWWRRSLLETVQLQLLSAGAVSIGFEQR